MDSIINFLIDNKEAIILVLGLIYELVMRRKPTTKDYTIVGFVYSVLDLMVKNRRKVSEDDVVTKNPGEPEKNMIEVDRTKIVK